MGVRVRNFASLCTSVMLTASLVSCAGPESLNVRVRNHAAHNLHVRCLTGEGEGKEERVYPGAFARGHAQEVLVRAPGGSIRIAATRAAVMDGTNFKYAHLTLRPLGRKELIIEVMVDNDNNTWAYTPQQERVPFPSVKTEAQ